MIGIAKRVVARPVAARPGPWERVALGGCAVVLVALVVRAVAPGTAGRDYTTGFAPAGATATAALLGIAAVLVAGRRRRIVPALAGASLVLLVWSAGGVVFDALRAAAVLGVPGLPPVVDWPGAAVRVSALGAAAMVGGWFASHRRAFRVRCTGCGSLVAAAGRHQRWPGYGAAALVLPYPLLKVYWWAGGDLAHGMVGVDRPGFPLGEVVLFGAAGLLALALAGRWGAALPRWVLPVSGYLASLVLLTMGALAGLGALTQALGLVDGPMRFASGAWVVWVVYGSWLLLGLALAAATRSYQRRIRPRCPACW